MKPDDLVARFVSGDLDPRDFTHESHVRVAYHLLEEQPLPETMIALRDGLKRLAAKAGHPEKYDEGLTLAFAFAIYEGRRKCAEQGWEAFARENSELLSWPRAQRRFLRA